MIACIPIITPVNISFFLVGEVVINRLMAEKQPRSSCVQQCSCPWWDSDPAGFM